MPDCGYLDDPEFRFGLQLRIAAEESEVVIYAKKKTKTPVTELFHKIEAYWRAANYLSICRICLYDNPLLKRPLTLADVKRKLLGH